MFTKAGFNRHNVRLVARARVRLKGDWHAHPARLLQFESGDLAWHAPGVLAWHADVAIHPALYSYHQRVDDDDWTFPRCALSKRPTHPL